MGTATLSPLRHANSESMTVPGKHVLIIEDEMIIALEVEALLMELGYQSFDIAVSAAEALAAAAARRPDLITADYRIVGGTGIEAVAAVAAALGPIPVVYVTGNAEAVALLTHAPIVEKPISPGVFAAACRLASAA